MSNHAIARKCAHCGKVFDSYNQRKTCSDACRRARKRNQDVKCKAGHGKIGNRGVCEICGKTYVITGTCQKYCSQSCQRRSRTLSGLDTAKRIHGTCIICGADFMTSTSSRAKTCGPKCASIYRTAQVKASAEFVATETRPQNYWAHAMDCPWSSGQLDTMPPGITSWSDPIMDPMSGGFPMITFNAPVAQEVAA